MAHIGQPFRALSLPKISSLNNYATQTSYLQVAGTLTPNSNKINIGISGSSISQYTINPTPKLVHNMAIPSTNVVTAFDAFEDDDKGELWCFALMANKVHSIRLVTISGTADEARGPTLLATLEENLLKQTVEDKVVSIRIIPTCKCIMVVLECGVIHIYDYQLKPVRSMNMSYKDVKFVEHFTSDDELYTFVLCDIGSEKTCFKLFKLHQENNTAWLSELNSIILEDFSLNDSIIIHQFGKVYRLSHGKMYIYNLPRFQLASSIQLPFLEADSLVSLQPISTNRVLLTSGNRLMLLDLLHNAILYERELSHIKTFQLLRTAVISGNNTAGNNRTIAIGVSTKHGSNPTSAVDLVTVDVGTGTLKDSLGKGFLVENPNKSQFFKPLFSKPDSEDDNRMLDFDAVYKELEAKSSSIKSFDAVFTKRLDLKREYYTEGDRYFNNVHFIGKVLDLIFANFNKDFPKSLTYLLTHPLFPSTHTGGLLAKFKTHPRLFKQAIVTCPNLPLDELLQELFTVLNEELALDLSLRILQDFTKDDIKKGIKQMSRIKMNSFIDFIISDSKELEERQKNKPQLFNLLSLVIDAVGLLGFEEEQLNRLANYIDSQVNLADKAIELLYLLEDSTNSSKKGKNIASNVKTEGDSESAERIIPLYSVEYLGV